MGGSSRNFDLLVVAVAGEIWSVGFCGCSVWVACVFSLGSAVGVEGRVK